MKLFSYLTFLIFFISCRIEQESSYYTRIIDVPAGQDVTFQLDEDTFLDFQYEVLPNEDSINLELIIEKYPSHGRLSSCLLNSSYSISCRYIPNDNFFGLDSALIRTRDGDIVSKSVSKISFDILSVPDRPIAFDDTISVFKSQDTLIEFPKAFDVDSDPSDLSYEIITGPSSGALNNCQLSFGSKSCIYRTTNNTVEIDEIRYLVRDETSLESDIVTLTLIVSDIPNGSDVSLSTNKNTLVNFEFVVLGNTFQDLTLEVVQGPSRGEFSGCTISSNISIFNCTYKSGNNAGSDSILLRTKKGNISSSIVSNISIAIIEDPIRPTVSNGSSSTYLERELYIQFPEASDPDTPLSNLTYKIVNGPYYGSIYKCSLTLGQRFCYYKANNNFKGQDSITFKVVDSTSLESDIKTFNINVLDFPVGPFISFNVFKNEKHPFQYIIPSIGINLDMAIITGPEHGTIDCQSSDTDSTFDCIYEAFNVNYTGLDSIQVKSYDGNIFSIQESNIQINIVESISDSPISYDNQFESYLTKIKNFSFPQASDSDSNSNSLIYEIVQPPQHGTLNNCSLIQGNRSCDYQANADYIGEDTFTYKVKDESGNYSNNSVIKFQINDFPLGQEQNIFLNKNDSVNFDYTIPMNSLNLEAVITTPPTHGVSTNSCTKINSTTFRCSYSSTNFVGNDFMRIKTKEGTIYSYNSSLINFYVLEVNTFSPISSNYQFEVYLESLTNFSFPQASDSDSNSNSLIYEIVQPPQHGTLNNCSLIQGNRSCDYQANADYIGEDTFTYKVKDESGNYSNVSTITVDIKDFPVGQGGQISTYQNKSKHFSYIIPSSTISDSLSPHVSNNLSHGNVQCNSTLVTRQFDCIYTPSTDYIGSSTFDLKVTDGVLYSIGFSSFTVQVLPNVVSNAAPVAYGDEVTISSGGLVNNFLNATDNDSSSDSLDYEIVTSPQHGRISNCDLPVGSNNCVYVHDGLSMQQDFITFRVKDDFGNYSNIATITINIRPPGSDTKTFTQKQSVDNVNIVWVIDNSYSMKDEQDQLSQSFSSFVNNFLNNGESKFPFTMNFITTDSYLKQNPYVKNSNGQIYSLTSQLADSNFNKFKSDFESAVQVGISGNEKEKSFASMKYAYDYNPSMYGNDNSLLVYIIVTDENEESYEQGLSLQEIQDDTIIWYNTFSTLKNNKDLVKIYTIINTSDDGDKRYETISKLSGGLKSSINNPFNTILGQISANVDRLTESFLLTEENVTIMKNSVTVKVNGVTSSTSNWILSNKRVFFIVPPSAGSTIEISYSYY